MDNHNIKRSPHDKENPYFMVSRDMPNNQALSYEAIGLLTYLLSKPVDWKAIISALMRKGAGRDKVRAILYELRDAGYAKQPVQYHDESGKLAYTDWEFSESPIFNQSQPVTGKPSTVEPSTANPTLHNTEVVSKEVKKEIASADESDSAQSPTPSEQSAPKPLSKRQQNTQYLLDALGISTLAKADEKRFGQIINTLIGSGIPATEFKAYVAWVRAKASSEGNWTVTSESLIKNGRMSEYLSRKQTLSSNSPLPAPIMNQSQIDRENQRQALLKRAESEGWDGNPFTTPSYLENF